jgi:hypothetical protein
MENEERLVERAARGDGDAFAELSPCVGAVCSWPSPFPSLSCGRRRCHGRSRLAPSWFLWPWSAHSFRISDWHACGRRGRLVGPSFTTFRVRIRHAPERAELAGRPQHDYNGGA